MRITALIAVAALLLAGCATSPPLPRIESARGDRVGVLVEIGDRPSHTHVGTTIFNNFTKQYPYDLNLRSDVRRTVERSVEQSGLTPVDLRAEGIRYSDVSGLIQVSGDQWQISPGKEDIVRRLRDQLQLKALLVVKETRVTAALECSGGPCSARFADASGLYTRSFLGLTRYHAVAAYRWNVYVFDPVADAATAEPIRAMLQIPAVPLPEFEDPASFENLTETEFSPVRDAILRFTETVSAEAIKTLNAR